MMKRIKNFIFIFILLVFFIDEIRYYYDMPDEKDVVTIFKKPVILILIKWIYALLLGLGLIKKIIGKNLRLSIRLLLVATIGLIINSLVYYLFFDFNYDTSNTDYLLFTEFVAIIVFIDIIRSKEYIIIGDFSYRRYFFTVLIFINIVIAYVSFAFYGHYLDINMK